jgi:hypothetical protein
LLLIGISSIKNMAFWIIVSIPTTTRSLSALTKEASAVKYGASRLRTVYTFATIGCLLIFSLQAVFNYFMAKKSGSDPFPHKAIAFLKQYPPAGNLFSIYNWGGYLTWQLPEKKMFIDGRMNSWRRSNYIKNESSDAFKDFQGLMSGLIPLTSAINTYRITTFLLPIQKPTLQNPIDRPIAGLFSKEKPTTDIYEQLTKLHWVKIYNDSTSVIYQKP